MAKTTTKTEPSRWKLALALADGLKARGIQADGLDADSLYDAFERPKESSLGDYALPCFRFGKLLQKKPQDVAAEFAEALRADSSGFIAKVDVVAAFLNITVVQPAMATLAVPSVLNGEAFKLLRQRASHNQIRTMIEFSQPNTHKEFHVGHGRNVCLGDSLVRLFRYCGYPVVAANYPGDEGTHIAKVLWHMRREKLPVPATGRSAWLGTVYAAANRKLSEADEATRKVYDGEVSGILKAIESKQGEIFELWRESREWSLQGFYEIYDYLDVKFDKYFFESEVSEESQEIVDEYLKKGVFKLDQGAVGIDLQPYKLGFSILRKSDGNTLYATKDLALARRKFQEFNIDRSIYVVANEQNHHFRQVFKTLELMGFEQSKKCFHLSYGMVMLPEGKMSSRDGNSVTFFELIHAVQEGLKEVLKRYEGEWTEDEITATAKLLCVGAVRYGMISSDPAKTVIFNLQEWLSFDGNSGPYLMYSYARSRSILRKADEAGLRVAAGFEKYLVDVEERDVIRFIHDFNAVVESSCENYKPSTLTHFLFEGCQSFNRFYKNASVLKAEDENVKKARVVLVAAFSAVLKQGLELLGIVPPERM